MRPELKPCPFCGEDIEETNKDDDTTFMFVHSDNGCIMALHCIEHEDAAEWNLRESKPISDREVEADLAAYEKRLEEAKDDIDRQMRCGGVDHASWSYQMLIGDR